MKDNKPAMNIIDKAVSFFNPVKGVQRQYARQLQKTMNPKNSGYSYGGASTEKRSMRGFDAESFSPQSDIDYNLNILRERSRVLEMTSPLASAADDRKPKNTDIIPRANMPVFMMGVTTLSVPSLIMLRKAIKPKLLGIFVAICAIGIIIVGYFFNAIQGFVI